MTPAVSKRNNYLTPIYRRRLRKSANGPKARENGGRGVRRSGVRLKERTRHDYLRINLASYTTSVSKKEWCATTMDLGPVALRDRLSTLRQSCRLRDQAIRFARYVQETKDNTPMNLRPDSTPEACSASESCVSWGQDFDNRRSKSETGGVSSSLPMLVCYWVGYLDFNFREINGFSTKPTKS